MTKQEFLKKKFRFYTFDFDLEIVIPDRSFDEGLDALDYSIVNPNGYVLIKGKNKTEFIRTNIVDVKTTNKAVNLIKQYETKKD